MLSVSMAAFLDESEKISAARMHGKGVMSVRKGRRPISAANLLRKEKDGKLHKFQHVKEAATGGDSAGQPDDVSGGWEDAGAAKAPKHRGEVPTEVKSTTMSTKEGAFFDELEKISTVPGAMGSVNPFTTGENPMSSPETRKKPSPGDIPSEGWEGLQDKPLNPSQMTGSGIYATPSNKMKRKGDVPTKEKDPSLVDRMDGRGEATTITGLAQNSAGIGAFNSPAEHVG